MKRKCTGGGTKNKKSLEDSKQLENPKKSALKPNYYKPRGSPPIQRVGP